MIIEFNGKDHIFPDDTPEDLIDNYFSGNAAPQQKPSQNGGIFGTLGQMAQGVLQGRGGQVTNTMPTLSNASFLTPEQTMGTMQIQQRSQENTVAQRIEQRQQQERSLEAEKDRAQQLKLRQQDLKNRIAEAKIQKELDEAKMKFGSKLNLDEMEKSGEKAERAARTKSVQISNREAEAALPPADYFQRKRQNEQTMDEQSIIMNNLQTERAQLQNIEARNGMLTPQQAARMNELDLIEKGYGVAASARTFQNMPTPQDAEKMRQQDIAGEELRQKAVRVGIDAQNQEQMQQFVDFNLQLRDYFGGGRGKSMSDAEILKAVDAAQQLILDNSVENISFEQARVLARQLVQEEMQGLRSPAPAAQGNVITYDPSTGTFK